MGASVVMGGIVVAVNLVTVSTINRVVAYQGQPTTSSATLYTAPLNTTVKITSIVVCNTTSTPANFTLYVVPAGGTAGAANQVFNAVNVTGNQTITLDSPVYLTGGSSTADFIAGLQGTSSALTLTINVETYA